MPDNVKHLLESASQALPFMLPASNPGVHVNTTRIVEAVLIAVIVGAGSWFVTVPELKIEMRHILKDVQTLDSKVETLQGDVNKLKLDVAVERAQHKAAPEH